MMLESVAFEWSAFEPRASLRGLPAIAIILGIGLSVGHSAAGMIAASGAMSVGFGSFQRIGKSDTTPMLLATIGMSVSILVGTLAGGSPLILAFVEALWGFLYGLLMVLGAGASWVGLQWAIALLVVSAYPVDMDHAVARVPDFRRRSAANRLNLCAAGYRKVATCGTRTLADGFSGEWISTRHTNAEAESVAKRRSLPLWIAACRSADFHGRFRAMALGSQRILGADDSPSRPKAGFSSDVGERR